MGVAQRKTDMIVPTGKQAGWLEARRMTKDRGGLPSHVLLDDILVRENHDIWNYTGQEWQDRVKKLERRFPTWAKEVLAYPGIHRVFEKGQDVVCADIDEDGRRWILPARYIPEEAIWVENVGLFIDPEGVEERDKVVVHPRSVVVLNSLPAAEGNVDDQTRIPVAGYIIEKRVIWKSKKDGVYPLQRVWTTQVPGHQYTIFAEEFPSSMEKVTYVDREYAVSKAQVEKAHEDQGIVIKGIGLEKLHGMVTEADANLQEFLLQQPPEKLKGMRRLIQALESGITK